MPGLLWCWDGVRTHRALPSRSSGWQSILESIKRGTVVCHLGLPTALGVWKEVGGNCRLPQEGFGVLERRVFKVTGPVVIFCDPFTLGKLRGHYGQ